MATPKEIDLERRCIEKAEQHGWLVRKMAYVGRRNAPDRWFFKAGRVVAVEFKRRGETPNPTQAKEHDALRGHGVNVRWIDNYEEFCTLLGL